MNDRDGAQLNAPKAILAFEQTKLVHGEEEAAKAQAAAKALFGAGTDGADIPTIELSAADFADGVADLLTLLVKAELVPSKSEARRAVEQGGVTVADQKVTDIKATFPVADFADGIIIRRGKKAFKKVVIK